jgi:UDP-N-acetylglucosamine--N-acetylmuramyl-(pentapeptide) pyrophosphoryl-undecaprenol N-acetylglucosamine transferase
VRLVICGGGTAGHVYPALALLDDWPGPVPDVTWIGTPDGMERGIVATAGLPFVAVRSGAVRGQRPDRLLRSMGQLAVGLVQAVRALRRLRPDAVLTTGGYVSVPVAAASWLLRIPVVVFLPDIRPGVAVRAQRPLATRVACAFDAAVEHVGADRAVVTGYPLRRAFSAGDRATARKSFDVGDELLLVLYGGSRGARTLNHAVADGLDELLARCRFVHVCGDLDLEDMLARRAQLPADLQARYEVHGFLGDRLVDAFVAADLCIARAGASTMAELPAAGVPAVVVPGAFSDQHANAEWLVARGAAVLVDDAEAAEALVPQVSALLDDDDRRRAMAEASRALARPDAAARLAGVLLEVTA